jgi:GxxExxY protein
MNFDPLSNKVIGLAINIHRELGPDLLESTYEACLACELQSTGITFQRQLSSSVKYKTIILDGGYKIDLMIENTPLPELKSISKLQPIHEAQILTYMKLANIRTGLPSTSTFPY